MLLLTEEGIAELHQNKSGQFSFGLVSVNITNFDGFAFDWSATPAVVGLVVASATEAELIEYKPPATSDTDVFVGGLITDISFCFEILPPPTFT